MPRKLVLIHGYSDRGEAFFPLRDALAARGVALTDINICSYITLNNEITIKDIAEGLERAFRTHAELKENPDFEFDAIVHSTGMLVIRSWLTNYGIKSSDNRRLKRLKHLIGLAPASWGSPQAHKGRTWLGALVKGDRNPLGPDFLNAGDRVLEGLELGSSFTWDLAHVDLLGPEPYYDRGPDTPYVTVFIGNRPYAGLESVANDPGTDGTVRWSGCGLNSRKIRIDLTQVPIDPDGNVVPLDESGKPRQRVWISDFALDRQHIPMIAVDGRNHGTIIADPEPGMVDLIAEFLKVDRADALTRWMDRAQEYSNKARPEMLRNPDTGFFGRLFGDSDGALEGWQQFVVHARDERGDPVQDYMVEVLKDGAIFNAMYTDVHSYGPDQSYRCFHIHLPQGISNPNLKLQARIHASTGTELMAYQGYNLIKQELTAESEPIILDLDLGENGTLFYPFTTTLVEIILNREPLPFGQEARILKFLPRA
ncbi:MAG: esterase/lipase family protein [Bryobacteraceae bacterium]